jgi:transitional endoplasmic reticulum ATPase
LPAPHRFSGCARQTAGQSHADHARAEIDAGNAAAGAHYDKIKAVGRELIVMLRCGIWPTESLSRRRGNDIGKLRSGAHFTPVGGYAVAARAPTLGIETMAAFRSPAMMDETRKMNVSPELRFTPARNDLSSDLPLSPTQAVADGELDVLLKVAPVVGLAATVGMGRTLLLVNQASKRGGHVITLTEMADVSAATNPLAFADAIGDLIEKALAENDFVAVDDFDFITRIAPSSIAPRGGYTTMVAKKILEKLAHEPHKRLLIAGSTNQHGQFFLDALMDRGAVTTLNSFHVEDYAAIVGNILGPRAQGIDFLQLFRHAARLTGHQLRLASALLRDVPAPTTEQFIEVLSHHIVASNVRTSEVEDITFDRLPGAEHIAEALETAIVLPLENRKLAQEMGLKAKRGVLLYGPPGTGKTVMGRALAHRMKGKFFLVDGSFISEPPGNFFSKLQAVVAEAKANSPSVLFIDDADVLFKIEHIQGVVRFLLSLLDGLESETANNVCVMMTAMDVRHIPDAVLRSGRVEVWLQTKLPDHGIRARILKRYLNEEKHLPDVNIIDFDRLASATEGFTQADLRRVAGDAKSLYASDLVKGREPVTAVDYVLNAVDAVIEVRGRMADSLGDEKLRLTGGKSKYFNKAAATDCGEACGY